MFKIFLFIVNTFFFLQVDPEEFQEAFDRVISIEMFEHMKNYGKLHKKVTASISVPF